MLSSGLAWLVLSGLDWDLSSVVLYEREEQNKNGVRYQRGVYLQMDGWLRAKGI